MNPASYLRAADQDTAALAATRRSWHGVAELVMAGPQFRRSGSIELRVVPGGFGTVAIPALRVDGAELVAGSRRLALAGVTYAGLAAAAGVQASDLADIYQDGPGLAPGDPVDADPAAAGYLAACFASGDAALRAFAPGTEPVLWPEHFDVAINLAEITYGVSLGDAHIAAPYAYVSPWAKPAGEFWNASFGAACPLSQLPRAELITEFFRAGQSAAGQSAAGQSAGQASRPARQG
jgi:hypothetical protein